MKEACILKCFNHNSKQYVYLSEMTNSIQKETRFPCLYLFHFPCRLTDNLK